MRWWLALAFATIAAVTAFAVAEVFVSRAESSFRGRAQEIAAGVTVAAAESIKAAAPRDGLAAATRAEAARRRFALFVFDGSGALLTAPVSNGVALDRVPGRKKAMEAPLSGDRYIHSFDHGRTIVIGIRLRTGKARAVVAALSRPELRAELGIVRSEIVPAALIAVAVGASVGLLVALLIALRIRRIARSARAIADGSFDAALTPTFRDELGDLASTVDRMRLRLRQSFADLEAERNRLRRLLERLHQGVVAVDSGLSIVFVNPVAERMLGDVRLDDRAPLAEPEAWQPFSLRRFAQQLFVPGSQPTEARVSSDDGRTFAVVGIPPPIESQIAVIVLTDVSERERRERAERDFVANAAHELRTPLTAIVGAVEALDAGAKEVPAERDRFLAVIDRQAARLARLTRALLVLARAQTRQEAINLEPVMIEPILRTIAADLHPRDGVEVQVDCPAGLRALAHRDLVEQTITNLAGNAARYVVVGTIRLTARPADEHTVEIAVSDTGPGVKREDRDRVFDRFYGSNGRSDGGEAFGLGLAIVRETVRTLGGTVELDSTLGVGTVVRVRLALAHDASE